MRAGRIFITGAQGMVGSAVLDLLHKHSLRCFGIHRNGSAPFSIDLSRESLNSLSLQPEDCVVHCAAAIPQHFDDSDAVARINRTIDQHVTKSVTDSGAKVIFMSSASVYGLIQAPVDEETAVQPTNPYSTAKWESEQEMLALADATVLRINAPYGKGQRTQTVLTKFIEKAILGADLGYMGSGKREQDFTAVEDIAQIVYDSILNDKVGGVFNVSGGNPITMRHLAELIVSLVPNCTSRIVPLDQVDPQEHYKASFSIAKAKEQLGWQPQLGLEEGIKKVLVSRYETRHFV